VQSLQQLTADQIESLPIDRLGFVVLKHLNDTNQWNSHNFLNSGRNLGLSESTLNNLGVLHRAENRMGEARKVSEEALSIYKRLAEQAPQRFQQYVTELERFSGELKKE